METTSLRVALADWLDWDFAQYALGRSLGLFGESVQYLAVKGVFWSDNDTGPLLFRMLEQMAAAGVLEKRDEPDIQFRWNPAFQGYWEK
jgi:hypothetical protein